MRRAAAVVLSALLAGAAACGEHTSSEHVSRTAQARLPIAEGALWGLCPAPDLPRAAYTRRRSEARRAARRLIAEVRRRPDALVTVVSEDAHTADVYRDEISVRELARRLLRNPGARRVPCARRLMRELQDAVEGRRSSGGRGPSDEPVFRLDEVVRALRLREDGAAYLTPTGCEVDTIYASRSELEPALRSGAAAHLALLTDPRRSVGVEAYRPSAACRAQLERGLAALASR